MVFREHTVLQVRSLLNNLEKENEKRLSIPHENNELLRRAASSVQEQATQPKLPTTRHAKSCLGSGLFHAVYKCRMRKVKFLLDNGLNINARNDYGYSVLVAALHIDNAVKRRKMFIFLLDNDADPLQRDPKYKRDVLGWASVLGRDDQVNLLLDTFMGEFDFHHKDRDGMTPLHLATQSGHTDVVTSLVKEMTKWGTSVDVPDSLGLTPYLHAKRLGHGHIADILKVEGGACEGQGDKYSFKRADEWRDIGIKERNEEVKQRRFSQYEQAAIAGSARMLQEFEGPGYEIISMPTPRSRHRGKNSARDVGSDIDKDLEKETARSVRIMSPKSNISMPVGTDYKTLRNHYKLKHDHVDGLKLDTMSLIQMRESKKGMAPKHFHQSEVDESKADEYKHVLGDLASMMEYLTLQHTKSFRRSVPPMKPVADTSVAGQKRSTLAILFGKGKKGRKCPASKSPGSGKKGKDKACSGKDKRAGKQK